MKSGRWVRVTPGGMSHYDTGKWMGNSHVMACGDTYGPGMLTAKVSIRAVRCPKCYALMGNQ